VDFSTWQFSLRLVSMMEQQSFKFFLHFLVL
jgi:hypothetical protein